MSFINFDPVMDSQIDCGQAVFNFTAETSRQ